MNDVSEAEVEASLTHIYRLHEGCLARGPCKPGARPIRGCVCRSIVRAALTAAAQVRERADGWQTVESAPKDGTEILGFWQRSGTYACVSFTDGQWADDEDYISPPTHWQPLTEPLATELNAEFVGFGKNVKPDAGYIQPTEPDQGEDMLGMRKGEG